MLLEGGVHFFRRWVCSPSGLLCVREQTRSRFSYSAEVPKVLVSTTPPPTTTSLLIMNSGGGGIVSLTSMIFCDIVPLRQRPKYFAAVLASWAIGTVTGPVVGGLCIDNLDWRWTFYINLPFCAIGLIMVPLCVKLKAVQERSLLEKFKGVDWIGGVLFIGSITVLLMGLSWAGVQYSWRSVQTLVPIVVGIVGLAVLFGWERWTKLPFLRASLFYNVSAIMAFYCALISGFIVGRFPRDFGSSRLTNPTDVHSSLLRPLLLPLRPQHIRNPSRRKRNRRNLHPRPWLHHRQCPYHATRQFSMGNLGRLVHRTPSLRSPLPTR